MEKMYTVKIAGFEMKLYSDETEAEMVSMVKSLNRKVSEYESAAKGCTKINALLLTCLDLCAENRRLKERQEELRERAATLKKQLRSKETRGNETEND